mmetsp:Transcript_11757/g.16281  ORF Transcript_11757/g.16281 Transcript_11757/m.16281 type:complete len:440 (-) Transcript_11757:78-1397(-)
MQLVLKHWIYSVLLLNASIWLFRNYDARLHFADNAFCLVQKMARITRGRLPQEDDAERIRASFSLQDKARKWLWVMGRKKHGYIVEKISVTGDIGPPIPVYLHRKKRRNHNQKAWGHPKGGVPLIVWFHGGGFVSGDAKDLDLHFALLRWLDSPIIVASVQYRLAPEWRFPAAVDDAITATTWLYKNAHVLGADPNRFCVGGFDAGGNLAAVLHREAPELGIRFHAAALFAPMLRYGATTRSYIDFSTIGSSSLSTRIWAWRCYCRAEDAGDPRCCPLESRDKLEAMALAPVVITTHRYDPLRDEGLEYANFLIDGNVTVLQEELRGSHSYALIADSQGARRAAKLFEKIVVAQDGYSSSNQEQEENSSTHHSSDGVEVDGHDGGASSAVSSSGSSGNLPSEAALTMNGSGSCDQADESSSSTSSSGKSSSGSREQDNQ